MFVCLCVGEKKKKKKRIVFLFPIQGLKRLYMYYSLRCNRYKLSIEREREARTRTTKIRWWGGRRILLDYIGCLSLSLSPSCTIYTHIFHLSFCVLFLHFGWTRLCNQMAIHQLRSVTSIMEETGYDDVVDPLVPSQRREETLFLRASEIYSRFHLEC